MVIKTIVETEGVVFVSNMCGLLVVNMFYAGPGIFGAFAVLKFMGAADSPVALWPSVTA